MFFVTGLHVATLCNLLGVEAVEALAIVHDSNRASCSEKITSLNPQVSGLRIISSKSPSRREGQVSSVWMRITMPSRHSDRKLEGNVTIRVYRTEEKVSCKIFLLTCSDWSLLMRPLFWNIGWPAHFTR